MNHFAVTVILALLVLPAAASAGEWKVSEGPLLTRWAKEVKPDKVHSEYPRPQMARSQWKNLNGLMTYDRAVVKLDQDRLVEAHRTLFLPPPLIKDVVSTSRNKGKVWRYTTEEPAAGFDDSSWKAAEGGFGLKGTPGAVVRTEWNSSNIWLRRTFELSSKDFTRLHFQIHHDEDAEVFVNGQLVGEFCSYTTGYNFVPMDEKACSALKSGTNLFAVHCRQTAGGQYIDLGLVDIVERTE